jgi:ribokinase
MGAFPGKVVVVGSLNVDYIAAVQHLPGPGQTIAAFKLIRRFGGKGANQAIAAARQGAKVRLIGCLGDDPDGLDYLARLKRESISVAGISRIGSERTGTALIAVDEQAENMIIVAAGANGALRPTAIVEQGAAISGAGAVLLQFETPMAATVAAIRRANRAGVPVVLNPSPFCPGFPWGRCSIDTLIVNAGEASAIFGVPFNHKSQFRKVRSALDKRKIANLIVTQGAKPTLCFQGEECMEVSTLRVQPLDTVGAGDAFAGTFAARQAEGLDFISAVRLANCAGALTTLKPGAQEAIPSRARTEMAARSLR